MWPSQQQHKLYYMVLWVVSTEWESFQTPVLISGTSLNLCLENRVHFTISLLSDPKARP